MRLTIAFALLGLTACAPELETKPAPGDTSQLSAQGTPTQGAALAVNAQLGGFSYSYAPSIIRVDGQYHAFFCSAGDGGGDWDHVRSVTSPDGVSWTSPQSVITSSGDERANCDPSVVRFDAGDGPYYYLFYSGNRFNVQTVNYVSRAATLDGPFLKWTQRGTWEEQPSDPQVIVAPVTATPDNSGVYGAGQPSVVVRNGVLYQWYTDDTTELPARRQGRVFLRTSRNATEWSESRQTNVEAASVDVKYDATRDQFVMFNVANEHQATSYLAMRVSKDGVTFSDSITVCDSSCMPDWANNPGISGDDQGHLIGDQVLVGYAAPYDLSSLYTNDCNVALWPYCWGHWNLYVQPVSLVLPSLGPDLTFLLTQATGSRHTELHTATAVSDYTQFNAHVATGIDPAGDKTKFVRADVDGDGQEDLVMLALSDTGTGTVEIHSVSGSSGLQTFNKHLPTAFVANFPPDRASYTMADWDGDGRADLIRVLRYGTGTNSTEIHVLSAASQYQTYLLATGTALRAGAYGGSFDFVDWDGDGKLDLALILSTSSESNKTEVHVLTAASGFQSFVLHAASNIGLLRDGWEAHLLDWDHRGLLDLVVTGMRDTGTHTVELHVLSGDSSFLTYLTQTGTGLNALPPSARLLWPGSR